MSPTDLLSRTANLLDSRPEDPATLTNQMMVVLHAAVPGADVIPHIRAAAELMAECPPSGLSPIIADQTGAEMLDRGHEFLTRRDGRTGAAALACNWMRAAAATGRYSEPETCST